MSPYTRHRKPTGETPEQTLARLNAASHTVDGQSARVGEEFTAGPMTLPAGASEPLVLRPSRLARFGWPVTITGLGLFTVVLGLVTPTSPEEVGYGPLFVIAGLVWLFGTLRCSVTLDRQGVAWRGGFQRGESAPWPEVLAVSLEKGRNGDAPAATALLSLTGGRQVNLPGFTRRYFRRSPPKDMVRLVDAIEAWRTTYGS